MAFDAKQAVIDKLTHLDDELKQAKAKADKDAVDNAVAISYLQAQIDEWQKLLAGAEKPEPKKTASKK